MMKIIQVYNKFNNIIKNNFLVLIILIFLSNFTVLFTQNHFNHDKNIKKEIFDNDLKIVIKNDGTKIDNFYDVALEQKVESDTNVTNKILNVFFSKNELKIKIQVKEKNKNINIKVYNMLGREVMKIFEGTHSNDEYEYIAQWNLPDGIFICVLQGENFRDAKKIIISR